MMDFSAGAGMDMGGGSLIPNGQVAWVIVNVRGQKQSQKGGSYFDIELTVDEGQPFAKRKIWEMVGNPFDQNNSESYRQMGMMACARMLECGRGAGPNNPAAYNINAITDLSGLRVGVKIKIEKGTGGYDDKNKVAEWLTPNPTSSGNKDFQRLMAGQYSAAAQPAAAVNNQASGFGFGGQPQAAQPARPDTSFGQPQPQGAGVQTAAAQPGQTGFAQTQAPTASPSNQPNWLQQANQ